MTPQTAWCAEVCRPQTGWLPPPPLLITRSRTAAPTRSPLSPTPVRASGVVPATSVSGCDDKGRRVQTTLEPHPHPSDNAAPPPASDLAIAVLSFPVTRTVKVTSLNSLGRVLEMSFPVLQLLNTNRILKFLLSHVFDVHVCEPMHVTEHMHVPVHMWRSEGNFSRVSSLLPPCWSWY